MRKRKRKREIGCLSFEMIRKKGEDEDRIGYRFHYHMNEKAEDMDRRVNE